MTTYLGGSMSGFFGDNYTKATEWRRYAKEKLQDCGEQVFDPTINSEEHFSYPASLNEGVIVQNYAHLKKCDLLLVNLENIEDSIGTIWELSVAWLEHKPVIAFGKCEKWKDRPHFQSLVPVIHKTVQDACDYILSMYSQKL